MKFLMTIRMYNGLGVEPEKAVFEVDGSLSPLQAMEQVVAYLEETGVKSITFLSECKIGLDKINKDEYAHWYRKPMIGNALMRYGVGDGLDDYHPGPGRSAVSWEVSYATFSLSVRLQHILAEYPLPY